MDLVITVIALIAAVLAIVPRSRRLDLQVRFQSFDSALAIIAFLVAFFLQFYDFFQAHISRLAPKGCWPEGLTPTNAIYMDVLLFAMILGARLYFAKLTPGKMAAYRDLIEDLYWDRKFGELITLLQAHLRSLFRIYEGDYLIPRLRAKLDPLRFLKIPTYLSEEAKGEPNPSSFLRERALLKSSMDSAIISRIRLICFRAMSALDKSDSSQQHAAEIIRGIFVAPRFLAALAQTRPYLGLDIIQASSNRFERAAILDAFLKELLRDPHSVFFREIGNKQNVSKGRYEIPETNRLLHYFLSDVQVAQELGVYKPIGDFLIAYLENLTRHPSDDTYNWVLDKEFENSDAWRSPLFIGIQFFDIMVKEALFQNVEWHMWLYYLPHIVEGIVRNYRLDDPLVDPTYELPTRYSELLYRIFSNIRGWILALEYVPEGQANVVLKSPHLEFDENGNIPKSSIVAMARCLFIALSSPNLRDQTKRALAVLVFNCYFDLRRGGKFDAYAQLLASAISAGKPHLKTNQDYRICMLKIFEKEMHEFLITRPEKRVKDLSIAIGFKENEDEETETENEP